MKQLVLASIIRLSLPAALTLALATNAGASTGKQDPSLYVGYKIGASRAAFGAATQVFSSNLTAAASQKDDRGDFGSLFLGVRLHENFGAEIAIAGTNKLGNTDRTTAGSLRSKTTSVMFITDVVGYLPINDSLTGYAKVGIAFTRANADAELSGSAALAAGEKSKHDVRRNSPHFAMGLQYRFSPAWALHLDLDRIQRVGVNTGLDRTGTSGLTAVSLGLSYQF